MLTPYFRIYDLELAQPWSIANRPGPAGAGIARQSVCLIKLVDADGVAGYGEASPTPRYGESMLTVMRFLQRLDWARLDFEYLAASLLYVQSRSLADRAVMAAVDMALHDGAAKRRGLAVHALLGLPLAPAELPPTCYSIGLGEPLSVAAKAAAVANRFAHLKLKVGPDGAAHALSALRAAAPNATVRIDANESWTDRRRALRQLELLAEDGNVAFVEQPMPRATAIEDLVWLKRRSPLPLIADESYQGTGDIAACRSGFHGVNVKVAKMGGIAPAVAALAAAREAGLDAQLGCMIESSLGIAAALQLASGARWLDLDGALLISNDPFAGVIENRGQLDAPLLREVKGLGVVPRMDHWRPAIPDERPIAQRAAIASAPTRYGSSRNGLPLQVWLPSSAQVDMLIFACIHGEEAETTALLSKALRSLEGPSPHCAVVLCANPDGALNGTRCNAAGVELNRNFPSRDWQSHDVSAKWAPDHGRVDFGTGGAPASEPETRALIELVDTLAPKAIVALHAPLACVEDGSGSALGRWLAEATGLPLVPEIGYATPGSFGAWANENGWLEITYELPPLSVSALHDRHLPALIQLLRFGLDAAQALEPSGLDSADQTARIQGVRAEV